MHSKRPISRYMSAAPITIQQTASLADAMTLMQEHAVRHLPVLDQRTPVGILSERDLAMARSLVQAGWEDVPVAEAMTPEPFTVSPETPIAEVARRMADERYGAALVADASGQLLGVFTTTNALELLAARED
jgi:acetoin utilization protein AcuB